MGTNKTTSFIILAAAGVLALVGIAVLSFAEGGPGQTQRFADQALVILALLGGAGGLVYQQGKTTEIVQQVQKQTNGTLTELRRENVLLRDELAAAQQQLAAVTGNPNTGTVPVQEPDAHS